MKKQGGYYPLNYSQSYPAPNGTNNNNDTGCYIDFATSENCEWMLNGLKSGEYVEFYRLKQNNNNTVNSSHVGGSNNYALADHTFVEGLNNVSSNEGEAVFGKFNKPEANALLSVGNGTGNSDRKNAFTVLDNNSIKIGNTILTEAQLKSLLALIQ